MSAIRRITTSNDSAERAGWRADSCPFGLVAASALLMAGGQIRALPLDLDPELDPGADLAADLPKHFELLLRGPGCFGGILKRPVDALGAREVRTLLSSVVADR